jgi:protein-tyrosine phosphatase
LKKILFVCLGNICRSPIAEGVARHIAAKKGWDIEVDSAGTSDYHKGEAPCDYSQQVALANGVDISMQRSRPFKYEDIDHYDHIIAMDAQNMKNLKSFGVKNPLKLGDFGYNGADVPDPYHFREMEGFVKVYNMIHDCLDNLLEEIYR